MQFLNKNIWWIFGGILVIVGGYLYMFPTNPCDAPLTYKIGSVDSRFGISEAAFRKDIDQAATIWDDAIDKKLFTYDPNGKLTINLVYDTRQEITQKEKVLTQNIDQTSDSADAVKAQFTSLKATYETEQRAYSSALAQFNQAQNSYNNEVSYWNSRGGAPKSEYEKLQTEKNNLAAQRTALGQKEQQLTERASQVNSLIDTYNKLVHNINANVHAINTDGLAGTQFEEGVYISDSSGVKIDIYQFENQINLVRVLAHELGHAIHLEHVADPGSIMSPVNQGTNLALSTEDIQELKTQCKIK